MNLKTDYSSIKYIESTCLQLLIKTHKEFDVLSESGNSSFELCKKKAQNVILITVHKMNHGRFLYHR